jgi:NADH-quinone oxidoreductase subunit M
LNGFVGEFLILLGAFRANGTMAAFAATGVILSAAYMLWMFQRVNYGPVTNEKNAALPDLQPREWLVIAPIIALTIVMGVFPNLFLRPIEPSVVRTLGRIQQGTTGGVRASVLPNRPSPIDPSAMHQPSALSNRPFRR